MDQRGTQALVLVVVVVVAVVAVVVVVEVVVLVVVVVVAAVEGALPEILASISYGAAMAPCWLNWESI